MSGHFKITQRSDNPGPPRRGNNQRDRNYFVTGGCHEWGSVYCANGRGRWNATVDWEVSFSQFQKTEHTKNTISTSRLD